jgi:hypothetical protein
MLSPDISRSMRVWFRVTMRPQISLIDLAYQLIGRTALVHAQQLVDLASSRSSFSFEAGEPTHRK